MWGFLFFTALAFLLVNSAAEEFPNPCKRSDLIPATEVNIRAAADTSDLQISSKFALLAVSTSFAYELQIEPFFIRYVLLTDINKNRKEKTTSENLLVKIARMMKCVTVRSHDRFIWNAHP